MDIRPIDGNALERDIREYADITRRCGHTELANGILKGMGRINYAPTLSLNTLRDAIYQDAVEHGLWDYPQYCRTDGRMLDYVRAACVERIREELTEAMEAVGDPDAYARELTDAAITIFSTFGHLGIDADKTFREIMEINKSRPWKHGKE